MNLEVFVHGHVSLMSQQEKKTSVVTICLAVCAFMSPCFPACVPFHCGAWLLCAPVWPPSACIFPLKCSTQACVFALFHCFAQVHVCASFQFRFQAFH